MLTHTRPARQRRTSASPAQPGLILAAVAIVQFMISLDLSVVNVGLPRIASGLGFSAVGLTWVINAYALTFGGLLLLGGEAADRYGRKRFLLLGLGLFGLASLAGGLAQAPGQLIAARAVQGVGAAALAPAALSLLTATFPEGRARIRAFGIWSAVNAAGGALGVVIGGLLTQYASWRWVMFLNVPMAAGALALVGRSVPAGPVGVRRGRPDVLGALLATSGMGLLVFGVVGADQYAWTSPVIVVTLALAVTLLAAFIHVERSVAREPLIRLGLLANRSVAGANAYNLLVGAAMASAFYFVSLYLQRVVGTGPARTGIEFLPFALGVIAGSVLAVKLGYRLAPRTLLMAGGLLTAAGFAWFGQISPHGAFAVDVLGPSIVASVGFGLCLGPVVSTATLGVAPGETGTASGLLNSSRQIGASLGLAALGTVAHNVTGHHLAPAALNHGYATGLTLSGALLFVAVLLAAFVLPRPQPRRPARAGAPAVGHPSPDQGEPMTTSRIRHRRAVVAAMYTGLAASVVAVLVPYVDHATANVLADHIRAGYPADSPARIHTAVTTYLVYLSVIGGLAIVFWLWAIRAVTADRRWARAVATASFALGTGIALFDLLVRDTSGDTGLPPLLGWAGMLPCLVGLLAMALLWRPGVATPQR